MRTGDTQATPTANPLVVVTVNGDTHTSEGGGGNDRLVSVYTDEQAWGGQYIVVLDNADEALNAKEYTGEQLDLTWGFIGGSGSIMHRLWVHNQTYTSKEGKLVLSLLCVDAWGLLSYCLANFSSSLWNQWWQADGATLIASVTYPSGEPITAADEMYDDLLANYDKTIFEIVYELISTQLSIDTQIAEGESDGIIDVIHPPMSVGNISSGVRQAMEMTQCFLGLRRTTLTGDPDIMGTFRVINPSKHDTVFAFSTANTHFINIQDDAFVAPNDIYVWSYNEDGNDWIYGNARDTDAYTQVDVPRHIMLSSLDTDVRSNETTLEAIATGYLSKIQASAASGEIEAPMHCSLELFDKVSVTDPRYATPKVSTGYVMRIIRQYDRGVYRIKIQLGGQTSGYTPPGGNGATGLAELDTAPVRQAITEHPYKGEQAYLTDIVITPSSQTAVSWNAGTVSFADGTTQSILAGTKSSMSTTPPIPVYYFYAIWGNTTLQNSTTYSDAVGIDRVLVGVAKASSVTGMNAYAASPFGDNILINRDSVVDGIIGEAQIAAAAVTNAKIAVSAIQGDVIAAAAITENKLATGSVTVNKIGANAVTAAKIAANTITAAQIAAGTITATQIAASTITGDKIYAGTISADKISAISLSLIQAQVATLSAITANCGTLTSGTINGATIYAGGGNVVLNADGAKFIGDTARCLFYHTEGTLLGSIASSGANQLNFISAKALYLSSQSGYNVTIASGGDIIINTATIRPSSSGYGSIGSSSYRLATVFGTYIYVGDGSSTSLPSAGASYRGAFGYTYGSGGSDALWICINNGSGYEWVGIVP